MGSVRTDGWMINFSELELGERLGAGSYGEVVRGRWRGTEVAVKSYHESMHLADVDSLARKEFESEVSMLSSLRHPNILNFLGAVVEGQKCLIVTELMPRGSLFYVLNKPSIEIDPRRRLRMALDVARGMNELHCHKIVHRDLKSPK
jgi:serine/threonine protein kinase